MAITKWNPFGEIAGFERELNRVINDAFGARRASAEQGNAVWHPSVDVHEDDNSYTLDVELPGLARENVTVNFQDGTLTISGERTYTNESKQKNAHRLERLYGSFHRSFSFPTHVESERISATFKDGVLTIDVPKAEEVKPKQIEIG